VAKIVEHTPELENPIRESNDDFWMEGTLLTLVEAAEGKKPKGTLGVAEGVAGKANIVNRNRRYYSDKVYALAVERAQSLIEQGRFLGEVDHPWVGSLSGAAFRFTKLYMEGDLMKFEGVILDTPSGRVLKALLDGGVGVAVSTRGYGSIQYEKMEVNGKEVEVGVVQDDYRMEGIDFVLFPSNPAGEITHHENANSTQQETDMTLEQLRNEHPELVAAIEAAAREGFVSQEELEEAVAKAKEEARNEVLEGDEVTALRNFRNAVIEALRPHVPELAEAAGESEESEAEREMESLRQQVRDLSEKIQALQSERDRLQAEQEERERREAIAEHVERVLEGFAHADLIRDRLLACESIEAVDAAFEEQRSLVESLAARLGVETDPEGRGTGKADSEKVSEEVERTPEQVAEDVEIKRQRELAGLE